jgi:hypothetical protein
MAEDVMPDDQREARPAIQGADAKAIMSQLYGMQTTMNREHAENSGRLDRVEKNMQDLAKQAVPGGDWEGHRRYHEAVIEEMNERKRMWREIRLNVLKLSSWGLIVWMLSLLANNVKDLILGWMKS